MTSEPSDQPSLYLVREDTGEIVGREPTITQARQRIEELERDLNNAEKDLRGKRVQIRLLMGKLDRLPEHYDRKDEVHDIFREWQEKTGHHRSRLDHTRFDAIRRMLEITKPAPWPREAFSRAIDGIAYDPNRKQRRNGTWEVFDDIELCCRTAANFERYIRRAPKPGPETPPPATPGRHLRADGRRE